MEKHVRAEIADVHARALGLFENGQPEEAARALRDGLREAIDPEPLNDLAVLENGNGNRDVARDLLQAVVRLYPEYEAAAANLAELGATIERVAITSGAATAGRAAPTAGGSSPGTARMAHYPKCYEAFDDCPVDKDIAVYLDLYERDEGGLKIFHFGTGGHHHIGLANAQRANPNVVFGITASPEEYQRYMELCLEDGSLGRSYHVYFGDIYNLRNEYLPELDIASMPHIGEYYDPAQGKEPGITAGVDNTDRSQYAPLDDAALLDLIVDKLTVGGRLLIYTRSHGIAATQRLLFELVTVQRRLTYTMMHNTVAVFTKIS